MEKRNAKEKGKTMKKKIIISMMGFLLALSAFGCSTTKETAQTQEIQIEKEQEDTLAASPVPEVEEIVEEEPKFVEYEINLMATGDNLMHMGVIATGLMEDGTYDYSFMFEGITEFLEAAEIKVTNQETILGGNELGFSGYPAFNSPTEVGDSIAEAGFNVVLQASNHSADKGINGLLHCVEFWKTHPEVLMVGIHDEAALTHDIPILTIEGIDFAVLNYTYGPNMETLPSSIRGHLDMLCAWNQDNGRIDFTSLNPQVLEDIKRAKELADVVMVFPHWGTEYMLTPSGYQKEFAKQMAEAGADLIVGTHPHVIQPVEWVESENGNKALCFYSLGNYVSTQKGPQSMLEAMAWVTFLVKEDGVEILEDKTGAIPMVNHYNSGPVRTEGVYLLENYTEEQAARHGILNYGGVRLKLDELQTWSTQVLGEWILTSEEAVGYDVE